MILITGGAYQGKLAFAKSICEKREPMIAEGEKADFEELKQADIIGQFHLYIRKCMEERGNEKENSNEKNHLEEETEIEEQVKELLQGKSQCNSGNNTAWLWSSAYRCL